MAVDERRRQQMYRKLEELLGPEEASTLMEHLPPVGWSDVVRQSDIVLLRTEMRSEMARSEDRLTALIESKLNSQTKTIVGLMSAQVLAVAGLAFAAARLA
jgi:hypothetical protein